MMLFKFTRDGVFYGFTPTITSKERDSKTYVPTIIKDSPLSLTDNIAKSSMTISFSIFNTFALTCLHDLSENPIEVVIYKNDLIYWQGVVENVKRSFTFINFQCNSLDVATRGHGVKYVASLYCNHKLYSINCGVNKVLWGTVYSAIASTNVITVSGLSQPDGYYDNGYAEMGEQARRIVRQVSTTITLSSAFSGTLTGAITLYPGCALSETACAGFNNLENGLMFARIPNKNPFGPTGLL